MLVGVSCIYAVISCKNYNLWNANMKNAQEQQQLKTKNITQINGYALTMQIRRKLKEEENVNMEIELSNSYCL